MPASALKLDRLLTGRLVREGARDGPADATGVFSSFETSSREIGRLPGVTGGVPKVPDGLRRVESNFDIGNGLEGSLESRELMKLCAACPPLGELSCGN